MNRASCPFVRGHTRRALSGRVAIRLNARAQCTAARALWYKATIDEHRARWKVSPPAWVGLAATFAAAPTLLWGLPAFGDDSLAHLLWQREFALQLSQGELYPRWLVRMDNGFGSPAFFFYPPFGHAFAAVLGAVSGLPPPLAMGWGCAAAVLLAGLGFHAWARRHCDPAAAATAAVLYMALPSLICVNVYVRAAYAEVWAMAWPPWILLGIDAVADRRWKGAAPLSAAAAALFLSHPPSCVVFAPFIVAYALLRAPDLRGLWVMAVSAAVAVALASPYLLPALTHGPYVPLDAMNVGGRLVYHRYFLFGPVESLTDDVLRTRKVHQLAALSSTAVAIPCAWLALRGRHARTALFFVAAVLVTWFILVPISRPLWEAAPLLQKIQFPTRFNVLLQFACAALAALAAQELNRLAPQQRLRVLRFALPCVAAAFVLFEFGVGVSKSMRLARSIPDSAPSVAARFERPEYAISRDLGREQLFPDARTWTLLEGDARARIERFQAREIVISVDAVTPATLAIRQSWYPGWKLEPAASEASLFPLRSKVVALRVQAGRYEKLRLVLGRTPAEAWGLTLGAAGLICMLGLSAYAAQPWLARTRSRTAR